ncbi:MAG TPA: protein kinase [Thermoleophilia bacterium]|nr:protein kinase [Thermoleophilia bacterium]
MTGEPIVVPEGYLVDRWRVRELIGSGAWGSVYAADEVGDGDGHTGATTGRVALKFLPTTYLTPGQRALLEEVVERESRFSLRADHPHLIRTLAVHTLSEPGHPDLDGAVVLVMERAAANLRDLLAGGGVPAPARLLEQVCEALAHMHAEGWVHGDLKPGNVLIMDDGSARIADFGVTAQVEGTHAYAPRIGSSDYLPPEWWTERVGEKGIPLRPTADIWAFGVLAHQALTGGLHPFPGAAQQSRAMAAQSYANGTAQLRLDAAIGPAWRHIIADCLAPDHESRSAYDAAGILARIRALGDDDASAGGGIAAAEPEDSVPAPGGGSAGAGALNSEDAGSADGREASGGGENGRRGRRVLFAIGPLVAGVAAVLAFGGWWLSDRGSGNGSSVRQTYLAGDLRPDAAVPAQYRGMITSAAKQCAEPEVTPSLIAAILKMESDFNPAFSDPATASYGIAGWTPEVFRSWAYGPNQDYMQPKDAIPAVSHYLCWLEQEYRKAGLTGDQAALLAAGYNSGSKSVIEANGVPSESKAFAAGVVSYARQYAS